MLICQRYDKVSFAFLQLFHFYFFSLLFFRSVSWRKASHKWNFKTFAEHREKCVQFLSPCIFLACFVSFNVQQSLVSEIISSEQRNWKFRGTKNRLSIHYFDSFCQRLGWAFTRTHQYKWKTNRNTQTQRVRLTQNIARRKSCYTWAQKKNERNESERKKSIFLCFSTVWVARVTGNKPNVHTT